MAQALQQRYAPTANESIAKCKAFFDGSYTRKVMHDLYNNLPDRERGLILIAGGMPPRDYKRDFSEFSEIELHKIRQGFCLLKEMVVQMDATVGDVRLLKARHFIAKH